MATVKKHIKQAKPKAAVKPKKKVVKAIPKATEPPKAKRKQWDKKELEQKKRYAYQLYTEHRMEQNIIAEITGVSEVTISKWKSENDWDSDKEAMNLSPEQMLRRTLKMYDRLLTSIEERDTPKNIPTSAENDGLNKLADAVKKLRTEIGLGHKSAVGKQFIQFCLNTYTKEEAIAEMKRWDDFINSEL